MILWTGGDIVKVVSLEDGRKEESWCHGIENFLVCSIVWGAGEK